MKDFDTLRHRVEETAERLSLAQSDRQQQTQSLIAMLGQLEEKYSAQEKQFAYYRERLEPLEQSNAQLTSLMENLLDLIDNGFGEGSLEPMRQAAAMAAAMLDTDVKAIGDAPSDQDVNPLIEAELNDDIAAGGGTESDTVNEVEIDTDTDTDTEKDSPLTEVVLESEPEIPEGEPEMATLDDVEDDISGDDEIELASPVEEDVQVIEDLVDLMEDPPETADETPVSLDDDGVLTADENMIPEEDPDTLSEEFGDLELEEEALSCLKEDIDVASDSIDTDLDAIAATDLVETHPVSEEVAAMAVSVETGEFVTGDETMATEGTSELQDPAPSGLYEDVSAAVLELETEEDTSAGFDDLPDVVKVAAAAANEDGPAESPSALPEIALEESDVMEAETPVPEMVSVEDTAEEAETIAALALAMEKETTAEDALPPEPSDIRSLLLRVEALAKKAESMRLAQGASMTASDKVDAAADETKPDGAAEGTQDKNTGVAA